MEHYSGIKLLPFCNSLQLLHSPLAQAGPLLCGGGLLRIVALQAPETIEDRPVHIWNKLIYIYVESLQILLPELWSLLKILTPELRRHSARLSRSKQVVVGRFVIESAYLALLCQYLLQGVRRGENPLNLQRSKGGIPSVDYAVGVMRRQLYCGMELRCGCASHNYCYLMPNLRHNAAPVLLKEFAEILHLCKRGSY